MNPGTDWIDQTRRVLDALRAGTDDVTADGTPSGSHPGDCRWCPVCQVAAVVRGERPELTAALADVLTATAAALRTFAEATRPDVPADDHVHDGADDEAEGEAAPETAPPPVQWIDIA
ncbi:MAG: uncharacterized protein JWQ45_1927 [Blastococcus sp.]|jgi:hypothetical protein|nr:uncharacterized protein [Blastococcus sp.]